MATATVPPPHNGIASHVGHPLIGSFFNSFTNFNSLLAFKNNNSDVCGDDDSLL